MSPFVVDVLPVSVPPQVDQPQWLVRAPDDSLQMLEQERWAAPLRDEIRSAVAERLIARWGAVDLRSLAQPAGAETGLTDILRLGFRSCRAPQRNFF